MDPYDKEFALSITRAMLKQPCAIPFIDQYDREPNWAQDIPRNIPRTHCLKSILLALTLGKYKSLENWKNDVIEMLQDSKSFLGPKSYVAKLGSELEKFFLKAIDKKNPFTPKEWAEKVCSIRDDFEKISEKGLSQKTEEYLNVRLSSKKRGELSNKEMKDLITASRALANMHDARAMFGIIHILNPNVQAISRDVKLDINELTPNIQRTIEQYVKIRFLEEDLTYPKP